MQPERAAFDVLARVESTPELLARIFAYLDTDEDLARACAVKRSWLASAGAEDLWQARCAQSFPLASALKLRTGSTLSYRRLLAQRRAAQYVARAAAPPLVAQQPDRQDYLLGIEIRKIGGVGQSSPVVTGGAVMFSALVDLDKKSKDVWRDSTLAASVAGGSTGVVLRAGSGEEAEPGGGTLQIIGDWGLTGLDLQFHVSAFLARKSDGKTLSLCVDTSRYDSDTNPGEEDEKDFRARRPKNDSWADDEANAYEASARNSTEYCWLIPGTGIDDDSGISIVAARLVLNINFGPGWNSKDEFYALAKLPSPVPEFQSEEDKDDWESQHQYWEVAVTSVSVSLRGRAPGYFRAEKNRCELVEPLLGLLEAPLLRHRWV
jgi:hypothetical protein